MPRRWLPVAAVTTPMASGAAKAVILPEKEKKPKNSVVFSDGVILASSVRLAAWIGPEERVDGRVCDCCQTALVRTPRGLLTAFRDRSEDEVRDIAVARFENGTWSASQVVAPDGWKIDGCPVNERWYRPVWRWRSRRDTRARCGRVRAGR